MFYGKKSFYPEFLVRGVLRQFTACARTLQMAVEQTTTDLTGYLIWWDLDEPIDIMDLSKAWVSKAKLPHQWLPRAPGASKALRRAVLRAHPGLRVKLDEKGRYMVYRGPHYFVTVWAEATKRYVRLAATPQEHPMYAKIEEAFIAELRLLSSVDVSAWLKILMRQLSAVLVRPAGGVYFLPTRWIHMWSQITAAIREVSSHKFFRMPVGFDAMAAHTLYFAIDQEVEDFYQEVNSKLQAKNKTLPKLTYVRTLKRIDRVEEKLRYYEHLAHNTFLPSREKLNRLRDLCTKGIMNIVGPLLEKRKTAS